MNFCFKHQGFEGKDFTRDESGHRTGKVELTPRNTVMFEGNTEAELYANFLKVVESRK